MSLRFHADYTMLAGPDRRNCSIFIIEITEPRVTGQFAFGRL